MEQLYVDEVVRAMDEVMGLTAPKLAELGIQVQGLTIDHLVQSYNNFTQTAHEQSDRYELSITAQDFMPDMSRSFDGASEHDKSCHHPDVAVVDVELPETQPDPEDENEDVLIL